MTVLVLTAILAAGAAQQVQAQQAPVPRVWAAQTGWNQVTLSWEEIPGAVEYRIYAGDPDATTDPTARRPITTLSGSGRGGVITGISRISNGLYLEAVGRDRRRIRKLAFNQVTPVRTAQVVTAPAEATAAVTGETEVTLSWTPVSGATAYILGRAVSPDGFRILCALCSTQTTYVDRDAVPGAAHSYTVTAVFPGGLSARTPSNIVTPGAPVTTAVGAATSGTPVVTTPTTSYMPPGQPAGSTTTYTPPGQPAGATSSYTPPGTSTSTAPSTTAPTATAGSPVQTSPTMPATTTGSTTQTSSFIGWLQQQVDSIRVWVAPYVSGTAIQSGSLADSAKFAQLLQQLDSVRSTATRNAGSLLQGLSTADLTVLQQAMGNFVQQVDAIATSVMDVLARRLGPAINATTTTHTSNAVWTGPCRVDYQRADNMWAAFGKPVGALGTESISLLDGQAKLFFTDWKYEKLRNDGTNYYGSHLRIATNLSTRPVKLKTQTAISSLWVTLNAGETRQFQVDLAQMSCTN